MEYLYAMEAEENKRLAVMANMQHLFQKLGFSEDAAKYVTEEELIDKASVLKDLDYAQCKQICKNTRKQVVCRKATHKKYLLDRQA